MGIFMNEQDSIEMTPLDRMVAEDQIQMLKAAIPYANPRAQAMLSIFAKTMELQRTIQMFSQARELSMMSSREPVKTSPMEMLQSISQFTSGEMRENLNGIMNAMTAIQMFQMYQEDSQTTEHNFSESQ